MPIKKLITEVLLVLSLYLILFFIWWRFRRLIKVMSDVKHILNDYEFFGDTVDTPKEGVNQHRKRECLKGTISKGKVHLLGRKWTQEKACDETINKTYAEYKQRELNETSEKTGKALGKHVIKLYSKGISRVVKIKDVKKLYQDIEDDLIIKDQMAGRGCLLVFSFGNYLAPVLIASHTANNLCLGFDEQGLDCLAAQEDPLRATKLQQNNGYESD